jgi:hypothetical protein
MESRETDVFKIHGTPPTASRRILLIGKKIAKLHDSRPTDSRPDQSLRILVSC